MKNWKLLALLTAIVALFVGCESLITDDQTDELQHKNRVLGNSYGGNTAYSGLDVVLDAPFNATVNGTTGAVTYADSTRVDFRSTNSVGRASTLTSTISSLNGAKFAKITADDYFEAISRKKELKDACDAATLSSIDVLAGETGTVGYFVAKLGNGRGYVMAEATCYLDSAVVGGSTSNTGFINIEYTILSDLFADVQ